MTFGPQQPGDPRRRPGGPQRYPGGAPQRPGGPPPPLGGPRQFPGGPPRSSAGPPSFPAGAPQHPGGPPQPPGGAPWSPVGPPQFFGAAPAHPQDGRSRKLTIGLAVTAVILALVLGTVAVILFGQSDVSARYERADDVSEAPFTEPAGDLPTGGGETPRVYAPEDASDDDVRVTSMSSTDCDPEKLKAQLKAEPEAAQAWAQILGLQVSEIDAYIDGLTPEVLVVPLQVTNHEYESGTPRALQSVLAAGTGVLVDAEGVPRVRCACGNPLLPASDAATQVNGAPSGFAVSSVVHRPVQQSPAKSGEVCGVIGSVGGGFVRVKVVETGVTCAQAGALAFHLDRQGELAESKLPRRYRCDTTSQSSEACGGVSGAAIECEEAPRPAGAPSGPSKPEEVILRPFATGGGPASGWTVDTSSSSIPVDCSYPVPAPAGKSPGLQSCSPSAAGADACYFPSGSQSGLCLQKPFGKQVVRVQADGSVDYGLAPRDDPRPIGLLLADGTQCRARTGGSWPGQEQNPNYVGFYGCENPSGASGGYAVWADREATPGGIKKSGDTWTVEVGDSTGPLTTKVVTKVYFVGTE
ncbi:MAG: hypothetical protein QM809_17615 [Gordonia sp. (in: high G+C Gram-positive bacteria)]|uniref:DUF6777 domain-containing protein n=1 Tax=Gordonia sp. (in: high G+C Gram-positive bacteria) TaxID=84139 RepID=UPI0039E5AEE1